MNNMRSSYTRSSFGKLLFFRKPPWLPWLLVAVSALLALILWTMPNLGEFLRFATQLPQLWQVASNRREIIRLVTTVFSPLILALLVIACCWLWFTITSFVVTTQAEENQQGNPYPDSAQLRQPDTVSAFDTRHSSLTLPITPIPAFYEETRVEEVKEGSNKQSEEMHAEGEEQRAEAPEDVVVPTTSSRVVTADNQQSGATQPGKPLANVTLNLLDEVSMTVQTLDGAWQTSVPLSGNAIRVQLLAYIACKKGAKVTRDRLLEDVFGYKRSDEDATPKRLAEAFDSHRKLIRADLRAAISRLNEEAGQEVIPATLDIFANAQKLWWLADTCRVPDLEEVESWYHIIEQAESSGQLASTIPEHVRNACESLITVYQGDFLENLLRDHPDEFDPWTQSWARVPFTQYRDYFLEALWYAADYEYQAGQALEGKTEEEQLQRQDKHYDCAARYFRTYAMRACSSRFDLKVTFDRRGRGHGQRVTMSERAIRRCLMLYGLMGSTHMVDKVYSTYYKHMRRVSADVWEPSQETLADLEAARSRTSAFRLQAQNVASNAPEEGLKTAERS